MDKKRIFLCGLFQESNSFNPILTEYENFESFGIFEGEACRDDKFCSETAKGMIHHLDEKGVEIVFGVVMVAGSGGLVNHKVVDGFVHKNLEMLKNAGKIDGIMFAMHGATLSDVSEDVCGDIFEAFRDIAGQDVPFSAAFDLHGNITEKIMKNTDYVTGFQAYPHVDQFQTGERAAKRMTEHLAGKRMVTVRGTIPMIAPAHAYTTTRGSFLALVNRAKALIESGEIVDYTIFQAQPWLDVKEMAATVVVIAESEEKAKAVAKELAKDTFAIRKELQGEPLVSIEAVIQKAVENKGGKPVILVDSADSPNAGAISDSAAVLEKLLPYRDTLKCAVAVTDKPAVEKAFALGEGAVGDFMLGATIAPKLTKPVLVQNAKVKGLYDGLFYMYGPQEKGIQKNVGKTVVLEAGNILIHVCSEGKNEGDLNFYKSFGIEPEECDLVCVKACTSFRAGYEPFAAEIYNTATPGAAGPVLQDLPFEKRPVPMYPFEEITEEDIVEPKRYR